MKIAVVILNWNGRKLLETFLPSLVRYSKEASLYVVDNASTDDSVSFVKTNFPEVQVVVNTENGGFSKGYNEALKQIDASIYALVNSDVEVSENWLSPVIEEFQKHPNTGIVQPKILDYKNRDTFEYAGAGGGFLDALGYPYCRGRIFNSLEKDRGQFDDSISIQWASGACFFIKSSIFQELEGFDEDYFAHQEEIDLCWRTSNLGHDVRYVGASTVYHVGGATLQESNAYKTFLNFRNSLYSLVKNLPSDKVLQLVFIRMCLDGIAGIRFVIQGRPIHTIAIVKSHISFYRNAKKIVAKRTVSNHKQKFFQTKSIVWSHFVMNIRKWNKLV